MMRSNIDAELRSDSARVIKTEITDEHLRELTSALAADVPADFTKRVMEEIRKERRSIALRHRLLRYGSAAIAALVIVPMAAIVVPAMIRGGKIGNEASPAKDAAVYEVAEDKTGDVLYSGTLGREGEDYDGANEIMTTSEVPPEEIEILSSSPAAAPDHMKRPVEETTEVSTSADTFAADTKYTANVLTEAPAITVLRSVIGTDNLDIYRSEKNLSEEKLILAVIRTFNVQREDFIAAAADLNLSFTQDELSEMFDTPLTQE